MQIKGQDELLNKLSSFTLDTIPRSILLEGARGSGKHLVANYIADMFNLELVDITDSISFELIESIRVKANPCFYLVNLDLVSIKDENTILKFLEEPLKNAFIILLTSNKNTVLQTVLNRCQLFKLANYSKEFLKNNFSVDDEVLELADTPGKIEIVRNSDVKGMLELANKIFYKIAGANFSNTLTITNKLSFGDSQVFDFDTFVDVLVKVSTDIVAKEVDYKYTLYYNETNKLSNNRLVPNVNKKYLFDNYLCNLRLI